MKKLLRTVVLSVIFHGVFPFGPALSAERSAGDLPELNIVYPKEGKKISSVKKSFVFGSVHPPASLVKINGLSVKPYRTGSFLAVIPFKPGEFKIHASAKSNGKSTELVRTVFVSSSSVPLPASPMSIDKESLRPSADQTVIAGDIVPLRFKGSPGMKAEFRVKNGPSRRGKKKWRPMTKRSRPVKGTYVGKLVIPPVDKIWKSRIEYRLTDRKRKKIKVLSPAVIRMSPERFIDIAEVKAEAVTLQTGPSIGSEKMGYDFFLPQGVKLKITGRIGNQVRVEIAGNVSRWTDEKHLRILPQSSWIPQAILSSISTEYGKRDRTLSLDLDERIPYRAVLSKDLKVFTVSLFYTISNVDRMHYDLQNDRNQTEEIRWSQKSKETVEVKYFLKEKVWGYDIRYEENKLVCKILFAPKLKSKKPLGGLTIAVDPGHSPKESDGAISPQGIQEGEVNYQISTCLKSKLKKLGAKVVLTRGLKDVISLTERGKRARESKADLFVSVHANAVPDGADPYKKSGFSVYYFQPHSFRLARAVHSSYRKRVRLPDDGLHYGNLAVCRITQMPSILTESAYLIRPDEEELLLSRDFQCRCSDAIAQGIVSFVRSYQ